MSYATIHDLNREAISRCRNLGLSVDCPADGLVNAEIAIIAEAPGEREKFTKLPLSGGSGKYLWDALRPIGINRRSCFISNVIKRQLRQLDDTKDSITKIEADHYSQVLRWELEQLPNLQYIVCLGNHALQAITGLTGVMHYRGSVLTTQIWDAATERQREITVIVLVNPAMVMREPKWEVMFKFDVDRLNSLLKGTYVRHVVETEYDPSYTEAIRWIDQLHDEKKPTALDIEVIANETACIGFANSGVFARCINFRETKSNRFSVQEELDIRLRIQRFVRDPTTRLIMQNGMFDSYWLWCKDRIKLGPAYFDTMLAHHTLYPPLPHNLGFITTQYTTHPFYKDEGKTWREGGNISQFWEYNGKDCAITFAAHEKMLRELQAQKLDEFFFSHVMRLQPHLIYMTVMGIKADLTLKERIAEETAKSVASLKAKFHDQVQAITDEPGYKPNPGSPKQMSELLFRKLHLVGRGTSTDAKNRSRMRSHPKTPPAVREMLDTVDAWAKENKFLGTYAEMNVDEDGRIRCEYKQTGVVAAPGRLSSSGTLWGGGTNLQNQPERAHTLFVADEGCEFSYFDLSQAEARVVGWHYKIDAWMQQFEQARIDGKYDAHRALASEMFDIPYDEVPKEDRDAEGNPTIRFLAKRCRHGLNYRMQSDKLAETLSIGIDRASELHRIYHRITPELERGWARVTDTVKRVRALYNAYGRRWLLMERIDDESLKSVVAFYPQSTVGDKVSRCIYQCHSDPEWPHGKARIALNIHDALIAINHIEVGDTVRRIMKKYAEEPISIKDVYGNTVDLVIPCDLKRSYPDENGVHRWSNLEKVKL